MVFALALLLAGIGGAQPDNVNPTHPANVSLQFVPMPSPPPPPDFLAIERANKDRVDAQQAEAAHLEAARAQQQAKLAAITPQPVATPSAAPVQPTGSHEDWMAAAGISPSDYQYVDFIVSHESGWQVTIWNGSGSGAYGLCQSLPAGKMAAAGADWQTNPVTQLEWCSMHAQQYGGWYGSYLFWLAHLAW